MPDPTDQFIDMSPTKLKNVALMALFAVVLQDFGCHAIAEQTRKSMRKSQPVLPSHAAPDVTSTIPTQQTLHSQDDEALPKPFDLPTAPRARMRTCGEKWQAIKMSGQAADQTWRDFAKTCLVDLDGSKKTAH